MRILIILAPSRGRLATRAQTIVLRAEAAAQGLAWYFTGAPCKRGHVVRRRVSNSRCEACEKASVSTWQAANPDKVKAASLAYIKRHPDRAKENSRRQHAKQFEKNPEKVRASVRAHWEKNRAKYYETMRLYRKNNPDVIRFANAEYRARKRAAAGTLTATEFATILQRQRFRCHWCDVSIKNGAQIDHVVPLVRGGEHSAANVVGSCGSCNRRKRSKDPISWANELGRLF
jgi:5-methylcytosine-specific restriction endonuclease McrA